MANQGDVLILVDPFFEMPVLVQNVESENESVRMRCSLYMLSIMTIILGIALGAIYTFNIKVNFFVNHQQHLILATFITFTLCCSVAALANYTTVSFAQRTMLSLKSLPTKFLLDLMSFVY